MAHPDAKAWDIGKHFGIHHFNINERLRERGFNIPKYTKAHKLRQKLMKSSSTPKKTGPRKPNEGK